MKQKSTTKTNSNYEFWLILIIIAVLYFYNSGKKTTTGNQKADKQLEEQRAGSRPQSGDINFKNKD